MIQAAPGWSKKTIWLDDLAKAGPVLMKFTHGVVPSKYEDRIPFAPFRLLGDETRYALQVETKELEGWLAEVPVMTWVIVEHTPDPVFRWKVTPLEGPPGRSPTAPPHTRRPVTAIGELEFREDDTGYGYNVPTLYVICDDGAVFLGQCSAGSYLLISWAECGPIPGTPREAQLADN
jgi:hypothetical protein